MSRTAVKPFQYPHIFFYSSSAAESSRSAVATPSRQRIVEVSLFLALALFHFPPDPGSAFG
jgi:hypothetical protein